jgi:hypothetical protein
VADHQQPGAQHDGRQQQDADRRQDIEHMRQRR